MYTGSFSAKHMVQGAYFHNSTSHPKKNSEEISFRISVWIKVFNTVMV